MKRLVILEAGQSKFFEGFSSGFKLNTAVLAVLGFRDQHIKHFETVSHRLKEFQDIITNHEIPKIT